MGEYQVMRCEVKGSLNSLTTAEKRNALYL